MQFLADGGSVALGKGDVGTQELRSEDHAVPHSRLALVHASDVAGQGKVALGLALVQQDEDEVETRHQSCWQVDVLVDGFLLVVASVEGVGSSKNGGSGVERGSYAGLGDGDSLLLHDFVDGCAVEFLHFVELVNAADSHVCQHKGACLQRQLLGERVSHNGSSQTHSRTTFACSVNCPWG